MLFAVFGAKYFGNVCCVLEILWESFVSCSYLSTAQAQLFEVWFLCIHKSLWVYSFDKWRCSLCKYPELGHVKCNSWIVRHFMQKWCCTGIWSLFYTPYVYLPSVGVTPPEEHICTLPMWQWLTIECGMVGSVQCNAWIARFYAEVMLHQKISFPCCLYVSPRWVWPFLKSVHVSSWQYSTVQVLDLLHPFDIHYHSSGKHMLVLCSSLM